MKSAVKSKVTGKQLEYIVERHFPGSELLEVTELTGGNISSAYILRGTGGLEVPAVLKTGMSDEGKGLRYERGLFPTEGKVYELLKKRNVPVPRILGCDFTKQKLPFAYFLMEYMEGEVWLKCLGEIEESRPELMEQLGFYTAEINQVTGPYFGYLKEGEAFHFPTWGEAFRNMMEDILKDGKEHGFELPGSRIEGILDKSRTLLDEIAVPKLVDFDLWAGNIFLRRKAVLEAGWGKLESGAGKLEIAGIIDFGHCMFGDPFAGFTCAVHLYKDAAEEPEFQRGYERVSGRSFEVTEHDRIRMDLYRLYMELLCTVETYRYEPEEAEKRKNRGLRNVRGLVEKLEGKV